MQLLEPYRGNYVNAESANKYIDIDAIISGCYKLSGVGSGFNKVGEKIYSAGELCDAKSFSIDGETLVDYIVEQGDEVANLNKVVTSVANDIMDSACNAYNDIQNKLNDNAYQQECDYVRQLNSRN